MNSLRKLILAKKRLWLKVPNQYIFVLWRIFLTNPTFSMTFRLVLQLKLHLKILNFRYDTFNFFLCSPRLFLRVFSLEIQHILRLVCMVSTVILSLLPQVRIICLFILTLSPWRDLKRVACLIDIEFSSRWLQLTLRTRQTRIDLISMSFV